MKFVLSDHFSTYVSIFIFFILRQSFAASIDIRFDYKNIQPHMELFEVKDGLMFAISKTGVVSDRKDLPNKTVLKMPLEIKKSQDYSFLLTLQNNSNKNLYFFAVPHVIEPPEASIGIRFECLCNHHVFKVGAHQTWYRVVRVQNTNSDFKKRLVIRHSIVGISEKEANTTYKKQLYDTNTDVDTP